jgi:hypothetical protein
MECAKNMLTIITIVICMIWTRSIQSMSYEQYAIPSSIARIIAEQEKAQEQIQSSEPQKY